MFAPLGFDNEKFKTELCVKYQELGSCPYNERCRFAHGEDELRQKPKPKQYKTKPCNNFMQVMLPHLSITTSLLSLHPKHEWLLIPNDESLLPSNRLANVRMVLVATFSTEHKSPWAEEAAR